MMRLKRFVALLLMLSSLILLLPTEAMAANSSSGKCGDNVTWLFDRGTATLTISGTGEMTDYSVDYYEYEQSGSSSQFSLYFMQGEGIAPWYSFKDDIEKIVITSGVTSVGNGAFADLFSVTDVIIPNSVNKIGFGSFAWCISLNEIALGNKTATIDDGAFFSCADLENLKIPESVTKIGKETFGFCDKLSKVTILNCTIKIGEDAFEECPQLAIWGYINSTVAIYAKNNNITFIALDKATALPTPKITKIENNANDVKITWGKVNGAAKYRVYRKTDSGSWQKIGDTTSTSYTDKTVKAGTKYTYTVRCVSSDGKTATSDYNKTGKSITIPLPTPKITAIENIAKGTSGIKMNWGKVSGASKYEVYRKKHGSNGWQKIATVTSPTYTDTSVRWMTGTLYDYSVVAVSSSARSAVAPTKTILRMAAPAITGLTNSAAKTIKATWSQNKSADGYQIWYQVGNNASSRKIVTVYGSGTLSRTISGLTKGNSYKVFVRSFKKVNGVYYYSAWSASRTVKVSK